MATREIHTHMPSAGLPPATPSTTTATTRTQMSFLYVGRNLALRTGEVSSHGRTNNRPIEPNISSTPPSLSGTERRMA